MSELAPASSADADQNRPACQNSPEATLRAGVHWLREYFTGELRPSITSFVLQHDLELFADQAAPEMLAAYLEKAQPFQTGALVNPYDLFASEYGLDQLPAISLGSIALESPADGEQDAA